MSDKPIAIVTRGRRGIGKAIRVALDFSTGQAIDVDGGLIYQGCKINRYII
jgi:hypothetical protein